MHNTPEEPEQPPLNDPLIPAPIGDISDLENTVHFDSSDVWIATRAGHRCFSRRCRLLYAAAATPQRCVRWRDYCRHTQYTYGENDLHRENPYKIYLPGQIYT